MTNEVPMLLIERPSDGVLLLRLNRPDKRNALATDLLRAVADALIAVSSDAEIRCVVITGGDRIFAAGADINQLAFMDKAAAVADPRPAIWSSIRAFPKPLIAAVEGWSLGAGNELVMCCDLTLAGESAKFGQPETNLGIVPGAGGTATLARLVGRSLAMRMVLTGEPITARQAVAAGLVSEVVADGEALAAALALAGKIASRAPLAMQHAKSLVRAVFDALHGDHLTIEREKFSALFDTVDKREGVAAFLERRDPVWSGR